MNGPEITRIADGAFRVNVNGRSETVYVAGPPDDRWIWWNGRAFRIKAQVARHRGSRPPGVEGHQSLSAPMPARVVRILVSAGTRVKKGETLLVLEAMKMELPVRALDDGMVSAVRCQEGQLVQPDVTLVELQ